MVRFTRALSLLLAATIFGVPAAAQTPLHELFNKGKEEFKGARYEKALATLKELDELSHAPSYEALRVKLEPMLAFYRGASLAALGRPDDARKDFETYLVAFPNVKLDPGLYPKAVLKAFEKTREDVERRAGASMNGGDNSLAAAYESWKKTLPNESAAILPKERWTQSALRMLMTKQEKDEFEKLADESARSEFAASFWRKRDPDPTTPDNEFQEEMERRLLFANSRFTQGEKRGSETDRGMVFVLLGAPTYIGQVILTADDDALQVARNAPLTSFARDPRGRTVLVTEARDPLTAERLQGLREIWHYRRDTLHKAIGFNELDIEFITKKGYGEGIMQRDPNTLSALGEVARSYVPKGK